MKHWSPFVLAYLLNGDKALGSNLSANCITTSVLPVISTTMCSGGSPAVPTALMPGGNANVPGQYSQPASAPSAVDPSSVPHVSMPNGSMDSPSAGHYDNPTTESEGPQSGADAHTGESSSTTQAAEPQQTTAPGVGADAGASNSSSEPKPSISGQASSATRQDSTATGPTSETSEAPETVSGASSSVITIRVNTMIMAGIVACFAPMMIHL
ncbi:hypothetical protein Forpe1208_v009759 [Fusarium oxysporum f. sp. rapae]|uniref:Uncharacterized protein n=1 Tax=Fusarium oxysporum f. sp. rapae TaxID=485398 RepID=A0A8J5TQU1_FUSOX|nr:hypothetical protein Forpe1208_v009759 [Fusarium oxysporum f. sp. rapae]